MDMIIGGQFITKEDLYQVKNPYNGKIVGEVPLGDKIDVQEAVKAGKKARKELDDISSRKLSRILYDAHLDLKQNSSAMAELITKETGKPIKDSLVEMQRSVETLLFSAEEAKRIYGETIPLDAAIAGKNVFGFTLRIPLGIVGAITPFNYPVNLAIHKLAPALAAKNSVIFKPSLQAPLAALKMAEILSEHLPAGTVNAVTGSGSEVGEELVVNRDIDKISFTGSVSTGLHIARQAGKKKLTLELGGNDALVVLDDADLEKAVEGAVKGSYLNAGQVCIAVKRIILQEGIADEFVDEFVTRTLKLRQGDPMDPKTDIGPLIDEDAAKRIEATVDDAIGRGAKLLCGGSRNGAFYEPTVLDYVRPEMIVVEEETFGPVSPILRVKNIDEALKLVNNTPYGLQAGVFTNSLENAKKAVRTIDSGTVLINMQPTFRTDNMPFGGFKMSGMGKEGVKYAVEDMTRIKMVVIG